MSQKSHLFRNLLIAICILLISYPLLIREGIMGKVFEALFGMLILRTGMRATSANKPPPKWAQGLLVLLIVVWLGEIFIKEQLYLDVVRLGLLEVFFIRFLWKVGRDVFITRHIHASGRLYGAICVYLLISAAFSDLYLIIDRLNPDAFYCSQALCASQEGSTFHSGLHLYFSLVTLSTLGYGDITPTYPLAAMLVALEAIIGQMYVAIVISRLVAIHLNEIPEER